MLPQLTPPPQHGGHAVIVLRTTYIQPSFLSIRAYERCFPSEWGGVIWSSQSDRMWGKVTYVQLQAKAVVVGECSVTSSLPPAMLLWGGCHVLSHLGFWCEDRGTVPVTDRSQEWDAHLCFPEPLRQWGGVLLQHICPHFSLCHPKSFVSIHSKGLLGQKLRLVTTCGITNGAFMFLSIVLFVDKAMWHHN